MRIELQNVNTNKLHDELIANGIIPSLVENLGDTTLVTVNDSEVNIVNAVVAKHNPSALPLSKSEVEILKEKQELIQKVLDDLLLGGV